MTASAYPVVITGHAVRRFIERVAPRYTSKDVRNYLRALTAPYAHYKGFRDKWIVDTRFGPLILVTTRVSGGPAGPTTIVIISVLRPRPSRFTRLTGHRLPHSRSAGRRVPRSRLPLLSRKSECK